MQPTNPNFPKQPQASDPTTETSDNSHELPITKTNVQQYADEVLDCDKQSGGQLLSPEQRETLQSFIDYLRLPKAWEQLPPDAEEPDQDAQLTAYNKFLAEQEKFENAASARNIDEFAKTVEATEASTEITISNPTSVEAVVQQTAEGPARRIAAKYLTSIREQPPAGVNQEDCVLDTQYVAGRIAKEIVQQIMADPNLRGLDHNRLMVAVGDLIDTSHDIARNKLNLPPAIEAVWGGRARQTLTAAAYQLANYNNLFFTQYAQNEEPESALQKVIDEQCGVKADIAQSPIVTAILAEQDPEKRVDFNTITKSAQEQLNKARETTYLEEKKRAASTVYHEVIDLANVLNDGQKPAAETYTLLTQAYNETVQNFVRRLVPTYGSTDYDAAFADQFRDYIIHSIATVRLEQANQELSESRAALAPTIDRIVQYAEANNLVRQAEMSEDHTQKTLAGMVVDQQQQIYSLGAAKDELDMNWFGEQARTKSLEAQIQEQHRQIWEQAKRIKLSEIETYFSSDFLHRPLIITAPRGSEVNIRRAGQNDQLPQQPLIEGPVFRDNQQSNSQIAYGIHAILRRKQNGILELIPGEDNSSTYVNGNLRARNSIAVLSKGDIVTFGDINSDRCAQYICIDLGGPNGAVLALLPPNMVQILKDSNNPYPNLTSELIDPLTRIVKRTLRDEDDRIQAAKAVKLQEERDAMQKQKLRAEQQVRELGQTVNIYRQALSAIEQTLNIPTIISFKPIVDSIKSIVANMKRIAPQEPNR